MSSLVYLKNLRLKSSQLSPERIFDFSFSTLDQVHLEQALFICSILKTCTSSSTEVLTADATDLANDVCKKEVARTRFGHVLLQGCSV